jgi:hypothetical protein
MVLKCLKNGLKWHLERNSASLAIDWPKAAQNAVAWLQQPQKLDWRFCVGGLGLDAPN